MNTIWKNSCCRSGRQKFVASDEDWLCGFSSFSLMSAPCCRCCTCTVALWCGLPCGLLGPWLAWTLSHTSAHTYKIYVVKIQYYDALIWVSYLFINESWFNCWEYGRGSENCNTWGWFIYSTHLYTLNAFQKCKIKNIISKQHIQERIQSKVKVEVFEKEWDGMCSTDTKIVELIAVRLWKTGF